MTYTILNLTIGFHRSSIHEHKFPVKCHVWKTRPLKKTRDPSPDGTSSFVLFRLYTGRLGRHSRDQDEFVHSEVGDSNGLEVVLLDVR